MLRTTVLLGSLVLLPLLLLGCPAAVEVDGVWYFVWEAPEPTTCTDVVDENYVDGDIPAPDDVDPDPWTFTDEGAASSGSFFGQIIETPEGALLIIQNEVLEGTGDALNWTFTWESFEQEGETQIHELGYRFAELSEDSVTTTLSMTVNGATAEGTASTIQTEVDSWTETDEWEADPVGVFYSQIPSAGWLFDDDGLPVENVPPMVDCQGVNCTLSFTTTCRSTAPFTAVKTAYEDEDAFDAVEDAGQPFGLGN